MPNKHDNLCLYFEHFFGRYPYDIADVLESIHKE
jgi:hypothetical protein